LGGLSRNAAARRFGVSIASAVRWVTRYKTTGRISPSPSGGDRRSGRIEAQRDYLLGLIRRTPDLTLLEIHSELPRAIWVNFLLLLSNRNFTPLI
jgi:transposase